MKVHKIEKTFQVKKDKQFTFAMMKCGKGFWYNIITANRMRKKWKHVTCTNCLSLREKK